jgi:ABC-2 type transport system permease protein
MKTLSPYLIVLWQLLLNSFAKLMTFRISFYLIVLTDIAAVVTSYYSADFIFNHIRQIGPWGRTEFMFFVFWIQAVSCLHTAIAAPNFWNFSNELQNGNLDYRLVRPLGSLFDTFTAITRPASFLALPIHLGFIAYYGRILHLSTASWFLAPILLLATFLLAILLELSIAMAMFWTTGGKGINFIRIQCQQLQQWPDFVYPPILQLIFGRLFPVVAAGTISVRYLLGQGSVDELIYLSVAIIFFWVLVALLWSRGLRRYESASS